MASKTLLLCAVLMAIAVITANAAPSEYAVPVGATQDEEWEYFKTHFKKTYDTKEENDKRKGLYFAKKAEIEEHNKKYEAGDESYSKGINHFADLTDEEFKKICCGLVIPESELNRPKRNAFAVPAGTSIDDEWTAYKKFFNKSYEGEEDAKRKAIYIETKKEVERHNKLFEAGEVSYSKGINHFADQTQEEFMKHSTGLIVPDDEKSRRKREAFEVPVGTSLEDEWVAYKKFFNKNYDETEDAQRKERYIETKKKVEEHNKKFKSGESTYEMGINQFADQTKEEFKKHFGVVLPKQ